MYGRQTFFLLLSLFLYSTQAAAEEHSEDLKTTRTVLAKPNVTKDFEYIDTLWVQQQGIPREEYSVDEYGFIDTKVTYQFTQYQNGIFTQVSGSSKEGYVVKQIANNSYFMSVKEYYTNGNIKGKYTILQASSNEFHVGDECYFSYDKKPSYSVNAEAKCNVDIEKVIHYLLEKENIHIPTGYIVGDKPLSKIGLFHVQGSPRWQISWNENELDGTKVIYLMIDANNGELISRHESLLAE